MIWSDPPAEASHDRQSPVPVLCRRMKGRSASTVTTTWITKLASIHSRIGIVLQTPHLFSGSVRDNIRYGRLDATDEEIMDLREDRRRA